MKLAPVSHRARVVAVLASIAIVSLGTATRAAAQTSATWDGASSSVAWSTAANWSGGAAPSGTLDTLTLPPTSSSCVGWSCTYMVDDIPGLEAGDLEIDASPNYLVAPLDSADSIELLKGLAFATVTPTSAGHLLTSMVVPLTLGRAQTWNLTGVAGTPTQLTLGAVSGEAYPLSLQLAGGVTLQAPELDTGPLTINGAGTVSLASQTTGPADGIPVSPPPLISTQGVSLAGGGSLTFTDPGAVSGPIAIARGSYSVLQVGRGAAPDGSVAVNGDVTLRETSTLQLWIDQPAATHGARPQPGIDYSQLAALGTVALHHASLNLSQGDSGTQTTCANLRGGQTYTLVSAAQLVGAFAGITNGQVIPLGVCDPQTSGPSYAVVIRYNTTTRPETVTATVVGPGQVKAEVGRALLVNPALAYVADVLSTRGYDTSFDAPAAGTLTLRWTKRVHGRLVTVARGKNVAWQVGRRPVQIKLTAAGRRLLGRSLRLGLGLALTATAQFSQLGQATITLRHPVQLG